jgi:hypothetical protein
MSIRLIALCGCLALSACGRSPAAPDTPFTLIGLGGLATSLTAPEVLVISDAREWSDFVRRSGLRAPSGRPEDPLPPIDFSSQMAVAVALGQRPSTAYALEIDRVEQSGSGLIVHGTEVIRCVGLTVLTYPLTAIAVPKTGSRVRLALEKRQVACQ